MTAAPPGVDLGPVLERPRSRWPRVLAYLVGVALLGAAIFAVLRQGAFSTAVAALADASPGSLALAAALPVASVTLTALTFWILTRRHGRVGFIEMLALINAGWLLNYLPMWPGMFGRLAYHKAVNGIALRDSITSTIWANVLALIAALGLGVALLVGVVVVGGDSPWLAAIAAAPVPMLAAGAWFAFVRAPQPDPQVWRIAAALSVRWAELFVWAARYSVCFALVGTPIGFGASLALAVVTGLGTLVPLTGNALGVREWIVGLCAPLLPVGLSLTTSLATHNGLSADLTNRAIEVLLAIPLGLIAAAWIAARLRRAGVRPRTGSSAVATP